MHRYLYGCAAALLLALSPRSLPAQDTTIVAVRGGTILPITGPEIKNGMLVVERGKITAVGPADRVRVPAGAKVVDATGKVIMPGLIDTHSHIADAEWNDKASPIQGDVRIARNREGRRSGVVRWGSARVPDACLCGGDRWGRRGGGLPLGSLLGCDLG